MHCLALLQTVRGRLPTHSVAVVNDPFQPLCTRLCDRHTQTAIARPVRLQVIRCMQYGLTQSSDKWWAHTSV